MSYSLDKQKKLKRDRIKVVWSRVVRHCLMCQGDRSRSYVACDNCDVEELCDTIRRVNGTITLHSQSYLEGIMDKYLRCTAAAYYLDGTEFDEILCPNNNTYSQGECPCHIGESCDELDWVIVFYESSGSDFRQKWGCTGCDECHERFECWTADR